MHTCLVMTYVWVSPSYEINQSVCVGGWCFILHGLKSLIWMIHLGF